MEPLRVLWCWPVHPSERHNTEGLEIEYFTGEQADLRLAARSADAVLLRRGLLLDQEVFASAVNLRYVLRAGTNTANIDLEATRRRGILVSASPMHIDMSVAEHAIALMLVLARRLVGAHDDVVAARYRERGLVPTMTTETSISTNWMGYPEIPTLFGRSLGLIGLGEIGTAVAERAHAFGMDVIYYRRTRLSQGAEAALGVRYLSLEELAGTSDFVSLHVPDTHETAFMINSAFLNWMRPSAFLVNVSRGRLVDEIALTNALTEGRIAGAGLDVFEQEPLPSNSPLLDAPNVVLTPHMASGTDVALDLTRLLDNLRFVALGQEPKDLVAPPD